MKKIYLAGPGVFRTDALEWGARLRAACQQQGLLGLYPLDQSIPPELSDKVQQSQWIFRNNCALIQQADVVLADVRAFRSLSEPDSGTAFEIGYAHALGKPVLLWMPDCTPEVAMHQRMSAQYVNGQYLDAQGYIIEDFAAPLNLMLWDAASFISAQSEPEAAIAECAQYLLQHA